MEFSLELPHERCAFAWHYLVASFEEHGEVEEVIGRTACRKGRRGFGMQRVPHAARRMAAGLGIQGWESSPLFFATAVWDTGLVIEVCDDWAYVCSIEHVGLFLRHAGM